MKRTLLVVGLCIFVGAFFLPGASNNCLFRFGLPNNGNLNANTYRRGNDEIAAWISGKPNDYYIPYILSLSSYPSNPSIDITTSSPNITINSISLYFISNSTSAAIEVTHNPPKENQNESSLYWCYSSAPLPIAALDTKHPISANLQVNYNYKGNTENCTIQLTNQWQRLTRRSSGHGPGGFIIPSLAFHPRASLVAPLLGVRLSLVVSRTIFSYPFWIQTLQFRPKTFHFFKLNLPSIFFSSGLALAKINERPSAKKLLASQKYWTSIFFLSGCLSQNSILQFLPSAQKSKVPSRLSPLAKIIRLHKFNHSQNG